ncbi:MAG TPA: hypothetical protein PLZ79_09085 [Burkholderiales bacterium]|nr:hypothetical protein [Burkholderiaceae bacterium]HQR53414.1 hypothetical protein [Burkholderiales bacterium]
MHATTTCISEFPAAKRLAALDTGDADVLIVRGDMIQLSSWFADVFAEVVSATGKLGRQRVSFCCYSKRGDERWLCAEFSDRIRRVVPGGASDVDGMRGLGSVLYFADRYFGAFGQRALWSTRLQADSRAHGNCPERMTGGQLLPRWPDALPANAVAAT